MTTFYELYDYQFMEVFQTQFSSEAKKYDIIFSYIFPADRTTNSN